MRNALATALTVGFVLASLSLATDAGRAFTAEAARRISVARSPRPIPPARLEDARGRELRLGDLPGQRVLVEFIFTGCLELCQRMSRSFAETARLVAGEPVSLLSVSFDPERDTPERLARYGDFFGADGERWRFARIRRPEELARWLEAFGVVAVPDGIGGFEHNAAVHELDRDGRLVAIHDFETFAASDLVGSGGRGGGR